MSFKKLQDGCCGSYLGYRNGKVLEVLNLPMPPTQFQLNPTYHLGAVLKAILADIQMEQYKQF